MFLDQERVNVCAQTVNMSSCEKFGKLPPECVRDRKGGGLEDMIRKLNGNHLRLIPGLYLEISGGNKM